MSCTGRQKPQASCARPGSSAWFPPTKANLGIVEPVEKLPRSCDPGRLRRRDDSERIDQQIRSIDGQLLERRIVG